MGLVGPYELENPVPTNTEGHVYLKDYDEFAQPKSDLANNEEILMYSPLNEYGSGTLYPEGTRLEEEDTEPEEQEVDELFTDDGPRPSIPERATIQNYSEESNDVSLDSDADSPLELDIGLSSAYSYKPSSIGLSFTVNPEPTTEIFITVTGARYTRIPYTIGTDTNIQSPTSRQRFMWARKPVEIKWSIPIKDVTKQDILRHNETIENSKLQISLIVKGRVTDHGTIVTVSAINNSAKEWGGGLALNCLFQTSLTIQATNQNEIGQIVPYNELGGDSNPEDQSLQLLYRNKKTFAVGHGCAAQWQENIPSEGVVISEEHLRVTEVTGIPMPVYETQNISPTILTEDGDELSISMAELAGLRKDTNTTSSLNDLLSRYEQWINKTEGLVQDLPNSYYEAAIRHLSECKIILERMAAGLKFLNSDPIALQSFQLANRAVLLQQIGSKHPYRNLAVNESGQVSLEDNYPDFTLDNIPPNLGKWRPFQIAFILNSILSTANPDGNDEKRNTVDLLWFPTGGGKTEAYLGLSAFSIFYRRIKDSEDTGVQVLMRYTLRLLTAQQFTRAASLLCAMEYIRKDNQQELGSTPFSIGIWLGSATTPNNRQEAKSKLNALRRNPNSSNPFLLLACPWCQAQIGPVINRSKNKVFGYNLRKNSVEFNCSDINCYFHKNNIPVYVIDEDIYEYRPDVIIAVVDKFAQLSWRGPLIRSLFGLDEDGRQVVSPPGLIIQDELHLISGPLGSMVGIYETVIDELCTDRRHGRVIPPKIIASTATIRGYQRQVKDLYGREDTCLFPHPGIDAGDSFFAKYDRYTDINDPNFGELKPGKKYVGIFAPGHKASSQTEVNTYDPLLQGLTGNDVTIDEEDPWWTLVIFYNSFRDLGNASTLFHSEVKDQQRRQRDKKRYPYIRYAQEIRELTSKAQSHEVVQYIQDLEKTKGNPKPVDVCLASNMIEVGIDIDRLGLMCVAGQPKTTNQYIQVTGRVGRRPNQPGLIVTMYRPTRPRERSHYEQFQSYHSTLYAKVEPTSVTPFAPPVIDRALPGIICAFLRTKGPIQQVDKPNTIPPELFDEVKHIILNRVKKIDPNEESNVEANITKLMNEWNAWERTEWGQSWLYQEDALLYGQGNHVEINTWAWGIPTSLRNVDASCEMEISELYIPTGEDEHATISD